jgi:hypothetical protein
MVNGWDDYFATQPEAAPYMTGAEKAAYAALSLAPGMPGSVIPGLQGTTFSPTQIPASAGFGNFQNVYDSFQNPVAGDYDLPGDAFSGVTPPGVIPKGALYPPVTPPPPVPPPVVQPPVEDQPTGILPDVVPQSFDEIMKNLGYSWETAYTPEQQFRQYATRYSQPGTMRDALYGMMPSITQRYLLASPFFGGGPTARGLGAFLQAGRGGVGAGTYQDLLSRAQTARDIGMMTGGEFADYLTTGAGAQDPRNPQLWQRAMYGTSQDAVANQLAAAQMLATMNPQTGRTYGGLLGQSIQSGLGELQQILTGQAQERDEGFNFLNWYLNKMARPAGPAAATSPVAAPSPVVT